MTKYYATITNRKIGKQFEVGEYSMKDLQKTLQEIHESGFENLDECQVYVYTVEY